MAIKFICSCGKHLKARDEMAARRSVCPACGSPVGIPSLQPTHRGTDTAPMTPAERIRRGHVVPPRPVLPGAITAEAPETPRPTAFSLDDTLPAAKPRPLDTEAVHPGDERQSRRTRLPRRFRWQLEKHWYQSLYYPLRALPLVLALSAALTLLCLFSVLVLPGIIEAQRDLPLPVLVVPLALFVLAVVAYLFAFWDCVLASGVAGEAEHIRWPGLDVLLVLRSGATWMLCFLAGPVVPAAVALVYWLNCGDPAWLDWLILAELGMAALAYWMLAVVAVGESGRLRDLSPAGVLTLVRRLGMRAVIAAVLLSALLVADAWLGLNAAAELHSDTRLGLQGLVCWWLFAIVGLTFLFRLFGIWCHRSPGVEAPSGPRP